MDSIHAQAMLDCDPMGPLMIQIVKLYNATDVTKFEAFGRVLSGTLKLGQRVRVLGEGYTPDDEEDMVETVVESCAVFESRYQINMQSVTPGAWVLLGGVDGTIFVLSISLHCQDCYYYGLWGI